MLYNQIADLLLGGLPIYVVLNLESKLAILYFVGYILSFFLNYILKYISRFYYINQEVVCRPGKVCNLETPTTDIGMPSGHTQSAAFTFAFIYFTSPNSKLKNITLILSILMGILRVLGEKHTPLQVGVGYFIGYGFAKIYYKLNKL
jgi:membrane-associated phospholipid phosphatase